MTISKKPGLAERVKKITVKKEGDKAMSLPDSQILSAWNQKKDAEEDCRFAQSFRDQALDSMND